MKRDIRRAYQGVLAFLGVDESFCPDFAVHNPALAPRSPVVHAMLESDRIRSLLPVPVARYLRPMYRALKRFNSKEGSQKPLDPEVRRRVVVQFNGEVERLSRLIERDLSHWLESST